MFDIYWNDKCVCGGYETEERAYSALTEIIDKYKLIMLFGGKDGPNGWLSFKQIDDNGFPSYHILCIVKNDYKIS